MRKREMYTFETQAIQAAMSSRQRHIQSTPLCRIRDALTHNVGEAECAFLALRQVLLSHSPQRVRGLNLAPPLDTDNEFKALCVPVCKLGKVANTIASTCGFHAAHTFTHTRTYTHAHTRTRTHAHTHRHTHTHTHAHSRFGGAFASGKKGQKQRAPQLSEDTVMHDAWSRMIVTTAHASRCLVALCAMYNASHACNRDYKTSKQKHHPPEPLHSAI